MDNIVIKKIPKNVGFWIRFLARMIDLTIVVSISYLLFYFLFDFKTKTFYQDYFFYIFIIFLMTLFLFFNFLIPYFWNGKTIGKFIMRIKIVSLDSGNKKNIIKNEIFYSGIWIITLFLILIIINHSLFFIFISEKNNEEKMDLTFWQNFRIGIVTAINSLLLFIQITFAMSIIIKKNKVGFSERLTNTRVIFINRFNEEKINLDLELLKPTEIKQEKIIFR